jgi:hypothetical protein
MACMMKAREVIYSTEELKKIKEKTDFDRLRRTSEKISSGKSRMILTWLFPLPKN